MTKKTVDEQMMKDYLLGSLSEKDTEQLDEMSVTNDDFVRQLDDVENDLVDAYVRGEFSEDTLGRFKSHYLTSARRRNKVAFAETFRDLLIAQKQVEKEDKLFQQTRRSPVVPFAWKFRSPVYVHAMLVLVIALLIYPTYRSFILEREVTRLQQEIANPPTQVTAPAAPQVKPPEPMMGQPPAPVISPSLVIPVRAEREAQQKTIRISFDENQTLALILSWPPDNYERYVLEMNRQNRNIWRQEIGAISDETAHLTSVTLHSGYFPEGEYELKISGKQEESVTELAVYKVMVSKKEEK